METTFYNTTHLRDKELREAIAQCTKQDEIVLAMFKVHPNLTFTPPDIHINCFDESTPITSVRRSITNLTKSGELEMTNEQREGQYGRKNYAWRLRQPKEFVQAKLF